jgi:3-dehydroquinate synthetase
MWRTATVRFGEYQTPYWYGVACADRIAQAVVDSIPGAESALLVIDRNASTHAEAVGERLRRAVSVHPYTVDSAERHKRLSLVESILEYAVGRGLDRKSVVIAMGGGLVGNVAGLAAALLYRGVRLVHLPTTPIAAFDAVLSQKQAVNLSAGKNLCGTYLPPSLIACDLGWLTTIPRRQVLTGIAEMAKNVLAVLPGHERGFIRAMTELDERPLDAFAALCALGIEAKSEALAGDSFERMRALVFEYGHTVGHALETVTGGRMSHGEAVAWGMLVAAEVSVALGHLDAAAAEHHHRVLAPLRLPPPRDALGGVDHAELSAALRADNKRGYLPAGPEEIPMVLLAGLGSPVVGPAGLPLTAVAEGTLLDAFGRVAKGVRSAHG